MFVKFFYVKYKLGVEGEGEWRGGSTWGWRRGFRLYRVLWVRVRSKDFIL